MQSQIIYKLVTNSIIRLLHISNKMTVTFSSTVKPTKTKKCLKQIISKYKEHKLELLSMVENGSLLESKTTKEFLIRYFVYICQRSSWHGSKHLINLRRHSCEL